MSTRFQTQGPRIDYEVVQQQKPGQQLMGLYNTWQSLAPSTRDWITSGFGLFGEESTDEYGFPVDEYGNQKSYDKGDREKLLDDISERETVPERQSWEGIMPIDIEVGAMDPYGVFANGDIKPIEPTYKSNELLSAPEFVYPRLERGSF